MFITEYWLSELWSIHIMESGAVVKKNEETVLIGNDVDIC